MKLWQLLVLGLIVTALSVNNALAVSNEPFGLNGIYRDEIRATESPGIGYSYSYDRLSVTSFQCDVALRQGDVCKIVYKRGAWEKSYIIDTPGEHLRGMDGEIKKGDSLTATITHRGSMIERQKTVIMIVDGKPDMVHIPHI